MFCALGVTLLVTTLAVPRQDPPSPPPPMPFHDVGVCPYECCIYRDWMATKRLNVWRSYDETGSPRVFALAPGERVTAMSDVVITSEPGIVRIVKPFEIEVRSRQFPRRSPERIRLDAGQTLYILGKYGEGAVSGWYNGRILEVFDLDDVHPLDAVVESEPVRAWWVKVRNSGGLFGWVRGEESFRKPGGC